MNQENSPGTALANAKFRALNARLNAAEKAKEYLLERPTDKKRTFFEEYSNCGIPQAKLANDPKASMLVYIPKIVLNPEWFKKPVVEMQDNYDNLSLAAYLLHKVTDPEKQNKGKNGKKFPAKVANIRCTAHTNKEKLHKIFADFKAEGIDLGYPEDFEGCLVCDEGKKLQKTFWGTVDDTGVVYSDPKVYPYLEQWTAEFVMNKLNGEELDLKNPEQKGALHSYIGAKIKGVDPNLIKTLGNAHGGSVRPIKSAKTSEGFPASRFVVPVFVITAKQEKVTRKSAAGLERTFIEDVPVYNEDGTPAVQLMFLDLTGKFLINNFVKKYAKAVASESSSMTQETEADFIIGKAYKHALERGDSEEEAKEYSNKIWELKKTLPNSFGVISHSSVSDNGVEFKEGYTFDRHNWDRELDDISGFNNPEIAKIREYCNHIAENFSIPGDESGKTWALTGNIVQMLVNDANLKHYNEINQLIKPVVDYWEKHHLEVIQKNRASYGAGSTVVEPEPRKGVMFSARRQNVEESSAPAPEVTDAQRLPLEPPVPATPAAPVAQAHPEPVAVASTSVQPVQQVENPIPAAQSNPVSKPETTKKSGEDPFPF